MYADGETAQADVCVSLPHATNISTLLSNGGRDTSQLLSMRGNPTMAIAITGPGPIPYIHRFVQAVASIVYSQYSWLACCCKGNDYHQIPETVDSSSLLSLRDLVHGVSKAP
ncbi:hypothetical protein ACN38_g2023 [Penicillium nordicum]|uniref:Uncharacterized protein n=1 Tax=Penicillium nordicum TaxID=229535 RepID=A0A0M8PAN3_9EURO|nr:hypothetical protein ACN38_g2023 [Penicillium nordicum]